MRHENAVAAAGRSQADLHVIIPGDPETPTGGFIYDQRMTAALRAAGWRVEVHTLPEGWPKVGKAAREIAARTLAAIPDGARVLFDGLALGVLPELAARESQRLRLFALVHHPLAEESGLEASARAALLSSERAALTACERVITTSPFTARALSPFGLAQKKIGTAVPGTDPAPLARGSGGTGGLSLLCVGAVIPRKGHRILIEALAQLHDENWRLTCVGSLERDPATVVDVVGLVTEKGLEDRVTFTGAINAAALAQAYDQADLFVLASHYEGYGMVVSEALARGLPVIATTGGAITETLPPRAGILVPPGDSSALAEALGRVLRDARLRQRIRAGALRAREGLPNWPAAAKRLAAELNHREDPCP